MKLSHQKLKIMYLAKILMEQTDEEHTITVPEMIAELSKLGISAERKSIYDDLEYLQLFGLDICSNKTRTTNYYIASRDFELPELKLLVDSVQASKFITSKKPAILGTLLIEEICTVVSDLVVGAQNGIYGYSDFLGELISYANKNNIEFLNLKQYYEKQKASRI